MNETSEIFANIHRKNFLQPMVYIESTKNNNNNNSNNNQQQPYLSVLQPRDVIHRQNYEQTKRKTTKKNLFII